MPQAKKVIQKLIKLTCCFFHGLTDLILCNCTLVVYNKGFLFSVRPEALSHLLNVVSGGQVWVDVASLNVSEKNFVIVGAPPYNWCDGRATVPRHNWNDGFMASLAAVVISITLV